MKRSAFTLPELLISIALALVIILGVNEVFRLTSRTVSGAQVLARAYRDSRSAQSIINTDFSQAAAMSSAPAMIIDSNYNYAWENGLDHQTSSKNDVTMMDVATGSVAVPIALLGPHCHRMDRIGFFATGFFQRQTGTSPAFIDTVTQSVGGRIVPFSSTEAWIVYGHLNIPDLTGLTSAQTFPGYGATSTLTPGIAPTSNPDNPNNFYASQWVLGRTVVLLSTQPQLNGTSNPNPTKGTGQSSPLYFQGPPTNTTSPPPAPTLIPLMYTSTALNNPSVALNSSRYDLAQTSIETYAQQLQAFVTYQQPSPLVPPFKKDYWTPLVADLTNRFAGYPVPAKSFLPGGSATSDPSLIVARVVPCFLSRCSHFAVEYTGDFIRQDPTTGAMTSAVPDGIPDFQVVTSGTQTIHQARWYGLPRVTSGNSYIDPSVDVVPLRDVIGTQQPFERVLPAKKIGTGQTPNYGNMAIGDRYVCAWGPDTQSTSPPTPTPTMLRLTVVLDDPSGTLGTPQTFEYVVKLPQ